jgi:hypothetical protein
MVITITTMGTASMGTKMHTGLWCRHQKENDHLEDLGVYGSKILKSFLKKYSKWAWNGLIWLKR